MRDPADAAGHREQRELAARRQAQRVHEHGERVVDIDELAGRLRDPLRHLAGELCAARRRATARSAAIARADRRACRRRGRSRQSARRARRARAPSGATSRSTSVLTSCEASTPAPPCIGALQRGEAGDHRVIEVEAGRGGAARGEGRGVQLMIGEQHQRAADQVGRVLVVGAPRPSRPADAAARIDGSALSMVATSRRTMRPPTMARPSGARVKARGIGARGQREHRDWRGRSARRRRAASAIVRISSRRAG